MEWMGKRAWIYCRIDAPEDAHGALKGQRKQLSEYAEQMGFTVIGSSEDLSASYNLERSGLMRVREAADAGKMDVLLIQSISCISRELCRAMEFLEELRQSGVAVCSPLEGVLEFTFQRVVGDIARDVGAQ